MVGNITDAFAALQDSRSYGDAFIDAGSSREVYLINGVIYKIDIVGGIQYSFNKHEVDKANRLRSVVNDDFVVPEYTLYDCDGTYVVACEYITGTLSGECTDRYFGGCTHTDDSCMSDEMTDYLDSLGYDISYGNVIINNGKYYLIDCG